MTDAASAVGRPADGTVTRYALPRGLIILLGLASLVVALAGARSIAWLIGPVFLALILVIALAPVQTWMRRRGWPGWLSTLVLILLVYAVLLGMLASIVVSIARLATEMPQFANQAQHYATAATNLLTKFGVGPEQLQSLAGQLNWGKIAQFVGSLLDGISGIATSIVFLLALLLFLSVETAGIAWRLAAVGVRPQVSAALSQFAVATRTYLVVTTVFGLIVAVLDTVALWIIGVPLAITWGLLSFITNYVPNIGFILGLIPPRCSDSSAAVGKPRWP
jgi:AI-2 transport protein TqsA